MPLVLFRDCGGKVLLRYVAYIEQKDGMDCNGVCGDCRL